MSILRCQCCGLVARGDCDFCDGQQTVEDSRRAEPPREERMCALLAEVASHLDWSHEGDDSRAHDIARRIRSELAR